VLAVHGQCHTVRGHWALNAEGGRALCEPWKPAICVFISAFIIPICMLSSATEAVSCSCPSWKVSGGGRSGDGCSAAFPAPPAAHTVHTPQCEECGEPGMAWTHNAHATVRRVHGFCVCVYAQMQWRVHERSGECMDAVESARMQWRVHGCKRRVHGCSLESVCTAWASCACLTFVAVDKPRQLVSDGGRFGLVLAVEQPPDLKEEHACRVALCLEVDVPAAHTVQRTSAYARREH
jgi:hypothetical protein